MKGEGFLIDLVDLREYKGWDYSDSITDRSKRSKAFFLFRWRSIRLDKLMNNPAAVNWFRLPGFYWVSLDALTLHFNIPEKLVNNDTNKKL